tara:strand:- start:80 stop:202 length:123 start_codon:yes stop_codon:yes gene_type:complete
VIFVIIKVRSAKEKVIAIFPVTLIPIGVRPNKFRTIQKRK